MANNHNTELFRWCQRQALSKRLQLSPGFVEKLLPQVVDLVLGTSMGPWLLSWVRQLGRPTNVING
jgi:hypothetical protein